MKITTRRYTVSDSIELTVKGAGMQYSVDLETREERLDAIKDLFNAAIEILRVEVKHDKVLSDTFHAVGAIVENI
jgi:hypothetical protein